MPTNYANKRPATYAKSALPESGTLNEHKIAIISPSTEFIASITVSPTTLLQLLDSSHLSSASNYHH